MQEVSEDFRDEGYVDDDRELTGRIKFSNAKLYGREKELQSLHKIFKDSCQNESSAAALISGYSGTGKSALVEKLKEEVTKSSKSTINNDGESGTTRCSFLTGKFHENCDQTPFSAISEALKGLSLELNNESNGDLQKLLDSTEKPNANDIIFSFEDGAVKADGGKKSKKSTIRSRQLKSTKEYLSATFSHEMTQDADVSHKWHRLSYNFRRFIQSICTKRRPLVLFLDDLQWADTGSLDLITSLLHDLSVKHFMFIGAIRSHGKIDSNHPLSKKLAGIIEQTKGTHRIELSNLSLEKTNDFISETLELECEETLPLTKAVYSKTRGNVFFTMQALEELNRKNAIFFSYIAFRWEWKLKEVEKEGERLSEDIVSIVAEKIKHAPALLQEALRVASYTGGTFDVDTLHLLMSHVGKHDSDVEKQDLLKILDAAVLESLLSTVDGSKEYAFFHDRIKEAALSLVSDQDRDHMRKTIGTLLMKRGFSSEGKDWMLFTAADHLNQVADASFSDNIGNGKDDTIEPIELVMLNSIVGKQSIDLACFDSAAKYLGVARQRLFAMDSHWSNHYKLTLRVLRASHDVELALGNLDTVKKLGQQVLDNVTNVTDAVYTYRVLAMTLAREGRENESLEMCMKALGALTRMPPKRFLTLFLICEMQAVKKLMNSHSDSDILALPEMTDEEKIMTSSLIIETSIRSYICGDLNLSLYCILHNIRLIFEHGLCSVHAEPFLGYGMLMYGQFKNKKMGIRMSALAKKVLEKYGGTKEAEANVYFASCSYIDAWALPPNAILETYQRAHDTGLQGGHLEYGHRFLMHTSFVNFLFGKPLSQIEEASNEAAEQCDEYKTSVILDQLSEFRFLLKHLIGVPPSSTEGSSLCLYSGVDDLDWGAVQKFGMGEDKNDKNSVRVLQGLLSRLQLAVFFDELQVAAKLLETLSSYVKLDTQYHTITVQLFYGGLTASGLYRFTKKRKYKRRAQKLLQKMKNSGGANNKHRYLLMQADIETAKIGKGGKKVTTTSVDLYDKAISSALAIGCTQDAALGCERAGKFLLSVDEKELSKKYLNQARDLYERWGAMSKVYDMEKKYKPLL